MKKQIYFILTLCCLVLASCNTTKTTTATTAEKTKSRDKTPPPIPPSEVQTMASPGVINFAAANDRYSANGTFKRWKFTQIEMKKGVVESLSATLEIDLSSISEKSQKLTDHLKAWDYFDVKKFTTATMNISNVRAKGSKYVADLSLDMRGASQKMESEFEVTGENPLKVKGTAMVDRSVFKIGVDNTSVPNLIEVSYEAALVK